MVSKEVSKIFSLCCIFLLHVPFTVFWLLCMNLLKFFAPDFTFKMLQRKKKDAKMESMKINSLEDIGFVFSTDMLINNTKNRIRNVLKEAQKGRPAPNPELVNLVGEQISSILRFAKAGRPLVVNFGSCT